MDSLFLITAIIGFIEFVKAVNVKNWQTAIIIFGSALIGGLTGIFHIDHLTVVSGIQAGLSASGLVKIGKILGGQ